ncbi:MAG TPA: class I SAM-dependent methyltransferase [Phycisphaerae bacterium]|nr:class I SAM-dependent methyltransferase [Phycisphaerae bacterium]
MKSTVEQIRARFDADVERFSNLETGQSATMDAPLCMDLVASAAVAVVPEMRDLLDIGCGAGNYTLKVLQKVGAARGGTVGVNCTLVDLSRPMLDRAVQRVSAATAGMVRAMQGDMREVELGEQRFDAVVTAATLHHLRTDEEWRGMFGKIYRALRPGGALWVFDFVEQVDPAIHAMMWERYGEYLEGLKGGGEAGRAYREHVFAYVAQEDTPRDVGFQLRIMREVGFVGEEILHKNSLFAAFGARRA